LLRISPHGGEEGWPGAGYPEYSDRCFYHVPSELSLALRGLFRIPERMADRLPRNDPGSPESEGDNRDGGEHHRGKPEPFHFTCHRCAATIAGPSGGRQDDGLDSGRQEFFADLPAEAASAIHRGRRPDRDVTVIVKAADLSLALELPQDVHRQDPIRVLGYEIVVEAAMDTLEVV